jgi:hypothetical protein
MLYTDLAMIGGDGVLERILFPIVEYSMIIKREKPSEVGRPRMSSSILSPAHPMRIYEIWAGKSIFGISNILNFKRQ